MSGDQPAISPLPDPPLRICLLSSAYPPAQYEGVGRHTNLMARGLFECGHSVHVITRGEKDEVAFYDGAYVHKVTFRPRRYDRYLSFSKLYHSLNHSHAVYDKVKQLMLNDGIVCSGSYSLQADLSRIQATFTENPGHGVVNQ